MTEQAQMRILVKHREISCRYIDSDIIKIFIDISQKVVDLMEDLKSAFKEFTFPDANLGLYLHSHDKGFKLEFSP